MGNKQQAPAKKASKADKKAAAAERALAQAAAAAKKQPKPKGARPASYTPNQERETARLLQQSAEARNQRAAQVARTKAELVAMQVRYPDLVAGVLGQYDVGFITEDGNLISASYDVDHLQLPEKDGKPSRDILGIFGHQDTFIPLSWLTCPAEKIHLVKGWRGDVQANMLNFLREHLAQEIDFVLASRARAVEEAKLAAETPKPTLATLDGKVVKPVHDTETLKSLVKFTTDTFGRFDFSSGNTHCVVVQELMDNKMTLTVISMSDGHPLAEQGVRVGLWLRSQSIEDGVPDAARSLGEDFFSHANLLRDFIVAKLASVAAKQAKQTASVAEQATEQQIAA